MKNKICFWVCALLIFSLTACGKGSSETNVSMGNSFTVKNDYYNANVTVLSVENNALVDSENYSKVKVKVENKDTKDFNFLILSTVTLLDSNDNSLGTCNDSALMSLYNVNDAISTVPANSNQTGYLYCQTSSNNPSKVMFEFLSKAENDNGTIKSKSYDKYIVTLK